MVSFEDTKNTIRVCTGLTDIVDVSTHVLYSKLIRVIAKCNSTLLLHFLRPKFTNCTHVCMQNIAQSLTSSWLSNKHKRDFLNGIFEF